MARLLGAGVAGALALGLAPGVAHAAARDTSSACASTPAPGFTDAGPVGSPQEDAIRCVAAYEVTRGTSATAFSPGATVTRGQMALFVYRTLQKVPSIDLPAPGSVPDRFTDDEGPDGQVYEQAINVLAELEVIGGYDDRTFRHHLPVTRAQTATIIGNEMRFVGVGLPATPPDAFTDDRGDTHEASINQVAALGIVQGTSGTRYEPGRNLTRGQMALILARHLAQLVDDGIIERGNFAGPAVLDDSADDGDFAFNLFFDQAVQEVSAESVANYRVANGNAVLTVASATLDATDPTRVTLRLSGEQVLDCRSGSITLDQDVRDLEGSAATQRGHILVPNCPNGDDVTPPRVTFDNATDGGAAFTLFFREPLGLVGPGRRQLRRVQR